LHLFICLGGGGGRCNATDRTLGSVPYQCLLQNIQRFDLYAFKYQGNVCDSVCHKNVKNTKFSYQHMSF